MSSQYKVDLDARIENQRVVPPPIDYSSYRTYKNPGQQSG